MTVDITITLTDEEAKAAAADIVDLQAYLQKFMTNKCRKSINRIIEAQTDKQPKKMSEIDRGEFIKTATIETRADREIRKLAETRAKLADKSNPETGE